MLARNMSAWSSKHQDSSSCWDLIPSSRMIYLFLHQPDEFPHTSFTWLTSPHMHRVHSDYLLIKRPRRRKRYGLKIVTAQTLAGIGELISNCAWNPLRRMVGKTRAMYSRRRGLLKTHFSSLLIPLTCSDLFTLTPVCHKVHALPRQHMSATHSAGFPEEHQQPQMDKPDPPIRKGKTSIWYIVRMMEHDTRRYAVI